MKKYTYEGKFNFFQIFINGKMIEICFSSYEDYVIIFLESSEFEGEAIFKKFHSYLDISSRSKHLKFDFLDLDTGKVKIFFDDENLILSIVTDGIKIKIESYDLKSDFEIISNLTNNN